MSENSSISWTDHTFNPWEGCTKVSPACLHCYAETMVATRYGRVKWGKGEARRRTSDANWRKPIAWNKAAAVRSVQCGMRWAPRVFCASLADWLDDEVPIEWLSDLLGLIHATPNLDWLLLTKRPENWLDRIGRVVGLSCITGCEMEDPHGWAGWLANRWQHGHAPTNVWMGTTVEDQTRADERIPMLMRIPARVRFLSCEPLLGPVNIGEAYPYGYADRTPCGPIDWVITGGESGHGARATEIAWIRSLKEQCADAGVAFHCKQITEKGRALPLERWPDDLRVQEFPRPSEVALPA